MSRLLAVFLTLLLASCATSKSGKSTSTADDASDNKAWSDSDSDSDSDSSSDSSKDSDSPPKINYNSEKKLPPGPACADQKGDVQECNTDSDCCKGFYCGLDPEGNARQKVCLYGGG